MYSSGQRSSLGYDEEAAVSMLKLLSKEDLQNLLDNEDRLTEIINDLQEVKNIPSEKETQLAMNKNLAENNLQKEPGLTQARAQLSQSYQQAVESLKQYEKLKEKLDDLATEQSQDTILALLQTEAAKSEEESENLADSFLDGNLEMEDFVSQYIQQRTVWHLRKVKAEKMTELMRARPTRGAPLPPIQSPHSPASTGWAPYPTGGGFPGMPDVNAYRPGYR